MGMKARVMIYFHSSTRQKQTCSVQQLTTAQFLIRDQRRTILWHLSSILLFGLWMTVHLGSIPFVIDRVCSTTVRYCFYRCLSVHNSWGGTPARGAPTWGTPWPGPDRGGWMGDGGYPLTHRDRTAHGVLDKRRSVCLLRSRRRTVLF